MAAGFENQLNNQTSLSFGARDPCAGRPPPTAALARPAIRGFPAAIAAGRGQAAAAPLSAPHGTGAGRPYPMDPTLGQAQPA